MEQAEHYMDDLLMFFSLHPLERSLYDVLYRRMDAAFPGAAVKVQKTQISFYAPRLFAAASLPIRRKKDWPKQCLLVTFGLSHQVSHPRIAVATEPYPNRWTHHVVVSREEELDDQLLEWLRDAYLFSQRKR